MPSDPTGTRDVRCTGMTDSDPMPTRDNYARAGPGTGQGMQAWRRADHRSRVDHRNRAADTSAKPAATPKPTATKTPTTDVDPAPTANVDRATATTARTPGIGADRQEGRDGEHQPC